MTIVAVNGGGNTPQGVDAAPPSRLLLSEPTNYSYDSHDNLSPADDSFVFQPQATGEPSGGETIIRLPDDVIIDASTDLFVDPLNPHVDLSDPYFALAVPTETFSSEMIRQVSLIQDL